MKDLYRQTHEYQEGRNARAEGIRRGQNPYASGELDGSAYAWWMGWDDEDDERREKDGGSVILH